MAKRKTKLTIKQAMFLNNLFNPKFKTQTDAYLDAYPNASRKAAGDCASRLMAKPHFKEAMEKRQKELDKKLELTRERILREEARIAFADPAEMFDEDGNMLPINEMPKDIRRAIVSVKMSKTFSEKYGDRENVDIRLVDKGAALGRAEKVLGLNQADKPDEETVKNEKEKISVMKEIVNGMGSKFGTIGDLIDDERNGE